MVISDDFFNGLKESKIIKAIKVPKGNYYYEYAQQHYKEGTVIGVIEIEHNIINSVGDIVGYFGVNWEHNTLVYYLEE